MIKIIEEAISIICSKAPQYADAYNNCDNKKANKYHKEIVAAMNFLIKENSLHELKKLISYDDSIAQWAAIYLLKSETQLAEKKLEEIALKDDSLTALSAEYTLIEWRNGDLDLLEIG